MSELTTFIKCSKISMIDSINKNHPNRKSMVNFVREASDFQILSFLVTGKFTKDKDNIELQEIYLNHIKGFVSENKKYFNKTLGIENTQSFLNEVVMTDDYKNKVISEQSDGVKRAMAQRAATVLKQRELMAQAAEKTGETATKAGEELVWGQMKVPASNAASGQVTKAVAKTTGKVAKKVASNSAVATVGAKGAEASPGIMASLYALGAKAGVGALAVKIGVGLTAAAVAALIVFAAYKTYQRFFSKAAKACKGYKSKEKTLCMNKFKIAAMKKQLTELKTGFVACKKAKNPDKCKGSIAKRYGKLNKQIVELSRKI